MSRHNRGYPIQAPYVDPPNSIERKSPLLVSKWKDWESLVNEANDLSCKVAADPWWQRLLEMLLGFPGAKHFHSLFPERKERYESVRRIFNNTIELRPEHFQQVMEYDRLVNLEYSREYNVVGFLEDLWDMFAFGEDYYSGRFPSYFEEQKGHLERAIAKSRPNRHN